MENSTEINSTSTGADGVVDVNTRAIDVSPFGRLNSIAVLFLSIISVKMAQKAKRSMLVFFTKTQNCQYWRYWNQGL